MSRSCVFSSSVSAQAECVNGLEVLLCELVRKITFGAHLRGKNTDGVCNKFHGGIAILLGNEAVCAKYIWHTI